MLIKTPPGWVLPERAVTPEDRFINRRSVLKGFAAGVIGAGAAPLLAGCDDDDAAIGAASAADDPLADLYPAPRNETLSRPFDVTDEAITAKYNNFYEFGPLSLKNTDNKAICGTSIRRFVIVP